MASLTAATRSICWSCKVRMLTGLPAVRASTQLRRRTIPVVVGMQRRGMASQSGLDDLLAAAQSMRDKVARKRKFLEGAPAGKEDEEAVHRTYDQLTRAPEKPAWKSHQLPEVPLEELPPVLREAISRFELPPATHYIHDPNFGPELAGETVTMHGFINYSRKRGSGLAFAEFVTPTRIPNGTCTYSSMQIVAETNADSPPEIKNAFRQLTSASNWTPAAVTGVFQTGAGVGRYEINLRSIKLLNSVDRSLIITRDTVFNHAQRHLELRTNNQLRQRLALRARAATIARDHLAKLGFLEVETPLLFKSTSEGAREFLVPSRHKDGATYALPQSPQQYKQILMASGISRYFQIARCFRDEDNRIDRQPEFTQLDLEMAFARGADVMKVVEKLMRDLWKELSSGPQFRNNNPFPVMTWYECMKIYGTDKPDLNYAPLRISHLNYRGNLKTDAFRIKLRRDDDIASSHALAEAFKPILAEDPDAKLYVACEETANGVPHYGLTGADIDELNERLNTSPGDVILLRETPGRYVGGSTAMGRLRQKLIKLAVDRGFLPRRTDPCFLWVTEFPLFTPVSEVGAGEGQGGAAGLVATHHPFTAPLPQDMSNLKKNPERVRAEHYDLVYNGVELGGGSRRIHDPALQRFVLEEIIKVPADRMKGFEALINVLGQGCPPHAGLAIGWDRMIACMSGVESVRDVLAFPKNGKGRDEMVGSPSVVDAARWEEYGLRSIRGEKKAKGGEGEKE